MIDPSAFRVGYDRAEDVPPCGDCGAVITAREGTKGITAGRWIPDPCEACRNMPTRVDGDVSELAARRDAKSRALKIAALNPIPERFADATLDGMIVDDDNRKGHAAARVFVGSMIERPSGVGVDGFGLFGGKGAGKTHVEYAIVNDLRAAGVPALIYKFTAIEKAIQRTFGRKDEQKELEDFLITAPLLVVDDLGKEPDNLEGKWAASVFADIVDDRWLRKLPMLVSSNFGPEELDARYKGHDRFEAIMDRLHDIFKLNWVAMRGTTRRG